MECIEFISWRRNKDYGGIRREEERRVEASKEE